MIRVLLWLLLLTGIANAQCAGGISQCPTAATVNPTDWLVISQPGGTGPTGFVTRKAAVSQLTASGVTMINDLSTQVGNPNTFFNPSYFGNPANAIVSRMNRIFVGQAALTSADLSTGSLPTTPSWVDTITQTAYIGEAQLGVVASIGTLAITGASRTSDYRTWAHAASGGAQGVTGFAYNDDTTPASTPIACGVCGAVVQGAGVNGISLNQMDAANHGSVVTPSSYTNVTSQTTWALGLTSGAYPAVSTANVSAAFYVGQGFLPGGPKFEIGGVFFDGSLNTANGAGGGGVAINFARGMSLKWNNPSGIDGEVWADANGFTVDTNLWMMSNIYVNNHEVLGGNAAGSILVIGSTSNGTPSGDSTHIRGSNILMESALGNPGLPGVVTGTGYSVCIDLTGRLYQKATCP